MSVQERVVFNIKCVVGTRQEDVIFGNVVTHFENELIT